MGSGEALSEGCAERERVALAQPVPLPVPDETRDGEAGAVLLGKEERELAGVPWDVGVTVAPGTVGLPLLPALGTPLGETPEGEGSAVADASAVLRGRAVV